MALEEHQPAMGPAGRQTFALDGGNLPSRANCTVPGPGDRTRSVMDRWTGPDETRGQFGKYPYVWTGSDQSPEFRRLQMPTLDPKVRFCHHGTTVGHYQQLNRQARWRPQTKEKPWRTSPKPSPRAKIPRRFSRTCQHHSGSEPSRTTPVLRTTYTDNKVEADTRYVYRVKAINSQGTSPQSRYVTLETAPDPLTGGVCARSEANQTAIVRRLGDSKACANVKDTDLRNIFSLHAGFASDAPMSTLQADDLEGLDYLEDLRINNAGLQTIENGAFAPVNDTLRTVDFNGNSLEPADLSELTSLVGRTGTNTATWRNACSSSMEPRGGGQRTSSRLPFRHQRMAGLTNRADANAGER